MTRIDAGEMACVSRIEAAARAAQNAHGGRLIRAVARGLRRAAFPAASSEGIGVARRLRLH